MSKSKVFIGPLEIANFASSLTLALRLQNIKANFYSYSTSLHPFGYRTDKMLFLYKKTPVKGLNRLLRLFYFIKLALKYNTFIFLSPASILNNNLDLPILRFLNKKIIFVFTGCAERDPDFDIKNPDFICNRCQDDNWQIMFLCKQIELKKKIVRKFEKYADAIISQSDSAAFLNEKKPVWLHVICAEPPVKNYLLKFNTDKLVIAHLPSNPLVKQSHVIIPILEKIAGLKNVEVIIKDEYWDRERVLSELDRAHILVDAIGLGYGMLAVEGMSRGCVVLNSFDEWFRKNVPEAPVYKTSAGTLLDDLLYLISHKYVLKEYARKSIEFYKKYHSPESAGKYYKEKLNLM